MNNVFIIRRLATFRRLHGLDLLVLATIVAMLVTILEGCSGGSTEGVGTVNISSAKAASAANSNPDMAKAASAHGKGLTGTAQKTRRK